MKKFLLTIMAFITSVAIFAHENPSEKEFDVNKYYGKKVAVFAIGNQFNYDANKRVLTKSGTLGEEIAKSNAQLMTNMLSYFGAKIISPTEQEALQSVINTMNSDADFSKLQAKAKELGVDYIFWEDMEWMMYLDQLFIYEYQIKLLDVSKNIIDRKSIYHSINAFKDANNMDAATDKMVCVHTDALKEAVTRITPRLWSIESISNNGKEATLNTLTFAGHYENDIFNIYKPGMVQCNLKGIPTNFVTLTPLAKSTKTKIEENNEYIISLDNEIESSLTLIASEGNLIPAEIAGVLEYSYIHITIESLDDANVNSYENHNKEITNYALYNAIHKNKMLKVIANPSNATSEPQYNCKLSNYSESKNIVKVQLTITDLINNSVVKDIVIESHTSNIDNVIAIQINEIFNTTAIVGDIEKNTISFYVQYPIAYEEGEKFLLSLNDENRTPIVIYELESWEGQKYVFKISKVVNKNIASKIGKGEITDYILTRYIDPIKDSKKDNSEFKKVSATNKLFDLIGQ